jgi:hypothetical protein
LGEISTGETVESEAELVCFGTKYREKDIEVYFRLNAIPEEQGRVGGWEGGKAARVCHL